MSTPNRLKTLRQESVKRRKNFFPTLVITLLLVLSSLGFIYFIDPEAPFALPLFLILLFVTFLFVFSLSLGNTRRGLIASLGITLFLSLRYLGVGNILNLLIILGLCIVTEFYYSRK